jgi:cytoskeletal protein RodZ
MTPDQKPEWFQIAEEDNAASTRKISKGLPIMALVAVAAIIGVGAILAQPQEQAPANATETVAPAVVDTTQTSANSESVAPTNNDAPAVTSANKESVAPAASEPVATKAEPVAPKVDPVAPKATATPGVANPLGKKPKNGEHEGGEHEGGEHEGGGEDD